ncbi:MAG: type II toxin-antitoxin system VapC family toxin [Alphaproteobacteria bacterium]
MIVYLDASVVIAALNDEATSDRVDPFVRNSPTPPLASDLVLAECSAAVSRLVRTRSRTIADATLLFEELDAWAAAFAEVRPITSIDIEQAGQFVRLPGLGLRAPDAIHIAAAARLEATLITLDRGMTRAAAALGLPCLNPADASAL